MFHFAKLRKTIDGTNHIQGDTGEKLNIFGSNSVGYCEENKVRLTMCVILSGNRF